MKNCLLLLLTWLLAGPLAAHAQDLPSTSYQTEHDSLWQRAARVRTFVDTRIVRSRSTFMALGGTSRRTKSFAYGRLIVGVSKNNNSSVVKKEVTKHKTHSADVAKVFYYAASGKLLLAELYQQHQLVRLQLYEYGERNGRASSNPFRTSEWVRGDHLHLTLRNAADTGGASHSYYFSAPRQPE